MLFSRSRFLVLFRIVSHGAAVNFATAILGIGIVASLALFSELRRHYSNERQNEQQIVFRNFVDDIEHYFDHYAFALRSLRNLISIDGLPALTRARFERLVNSYAMSDQLPGARAIGLIRAVRPEELGQFILERRIFDGYADFDIKPSSEHNDVRFVVQYLTQFNKNHDLIGTDVSREVIRRTAALEAVKRNTPTLSAPLKLLQTFDQGMNGMIMLLPVFKAGAPIETPQQRAEALEGWVYSPLSVKDALTEISARYQQWRVRVTDLEAEGAENFLDTISTARALTPELSTTLAIQGRTWRITGAKDVGRITAIGNHEPYLLALGTLILFILIAAATFVRTRHRAKEEQLTLEQARLADIVAHASDAMLSCDTDGRIVSWNAAACRLFLLADDAAAGSDVRALFVEGPELILANMKSGRDLPDGGLTVNTLCKRFDGSQFPALISFFALRNDARQLGISVRDMSDQKAFEDCILELTHKLQAEVKERTSQLNQSLALQAKIQHLAMHDPLTSLANRTLFRERLLAAVELHAREADKTFAILALDLDRFKPVNDTHGHPVGDAVLAQIGERLRSCLTEGDTPARLGGDEFAILLKAGTTQAEAVDIAKRVLVVVARPFCVRGLTLDIGVSVGIAVHDASTRCVDADTIFKLADHALYKAKRNGRGSYDICANPQEAEQPHASQLAVEMREGLRRGDFHLQYQPIIDCAMGRLDGFEALLRWRHPTRGAVSPVEFIPVAEESEQIVELGQFALRTACEEAARWDSDVCISVNVSPLQIKRAGWDEQVIATVKETGIEPSRLMIEVTESVLMTDSDQVLESLERLQDYGISIALDDFGTGYSSLSYLRKFRFDKLKIDKSFMRDSADVVCAAIIRCIVRLGRQLSVQVVAEGIETERQLQLAEQEGCSHAQGYYFSKPLDPKAARNFIQEARGWHARSMRRELEPALLKSA